MVLATEIVDWRRFERPTQLAAYLGLVSREDSSGDRERKGSITKAGNSHCRHVLVQAAWSYHHRPAISVGSQATTGGTAAGGDRARVESAAAVASALHASRVSQATADRGRRRRARARRLPLGGDAGLPHGERRRRRPNPLIAPTLECRRVVCGSRCEHSRGRYADRVSQSAISPCLECASSRRIQFLPRCRSDHGNRRISAGLTVDATADPRSFQFSLDNSPVISTPQLSCERVK